MSQEAASNPPPQDSAPTSSAKIQLDNFLKTNQLVESGGQAKMLIQSGSVCVNGDVETRRSKKLVAGDVVGLDGHEYVVAFPA